MDRPRKSNAGRKRTVDGTHVVTVRLNAGQRRTVEALAAELGIPISDVIRFALAELALRKAS